MDKLIAAVIVLYHPDMERLLKNIESYIASVDRLYLIDNTPVLNAYFSQNNVSKIHYFSYMKNMGIGCALNKGVELASKDGYQWVLTMDQDSKLRTEDVFIMYEYAQANFLNNHIAIVAACPSSEKRISKDLYQKCITVYTSGNLLLVDAWKKVGGWDEWLFIDCVDHMFNYKLITSGYSIIQLNNIRMTHCLGIPKVIKFCGIYICTVSNHHWIRRYYSTRNRLYMYKHTSGVFLKFVHNDKKTFIREFLKILFFETDKLKKIYSIYQGIIDFKHNCFGEKEW